MLAGVHDELAFKVNVAVRGIADPDNLRPVIAVIAAPLELTARQLLLLERL